MKSCSYSIDNINMCSRLLTLPHTYLLTCKTLNIPSTCFSQGRNGQVSKPRPTQIPEGKMWCIQRTLWEKFPSLTCTGYEEDTFHFPLHFLFCSRVCIRKNTIEQQSSSDQEGTRLRIKFIFGKGRRKKITGPWMTSLSSLINLNALPLYCIIYCKTRPLLFRSF